MGRRKKEFAPEAPIPMNDDALNVPVETVADNSSDEIVAEVAASIEQPNVAEIEPKLAEISPKKIYCSASRVNVRSKADGEVLYTIPNLSKVLVEEEKDGWCKIVGYVMSNLITDL